MGVAHFKQLDWDFQDSNSKEFIHNLCWYPSRFIPMIPAQLISALSHPGELVFDPFGGSGTVLLESLRQRRNSICSDLNPIGNFIAETKARIFSKQQFNMETFISLSETLYSVLQNNKNLNIFSVGAKLYEFKEIKVQNASLIQPWYHNDTYKELLMLFGFIESINHTLTRDVLKLIFISILMPSSGHKAGRPYTYYADNVKPKNPIKKSAFKLYYQRLHRFISEYQENTSYINSDQKWEVITGDTRNLPERLRGTADLIVTSPPYLGVTDYLTAFRLSLQWYSWGFDLEAQKRCEIGARWRRKQTNKTEIYLNDLKISFSKIIDTLKPNKHLCIILGESKKNQKKIIKYLSEFLVEQENCTIVHIASRELSQKFFVHPSGGVKTEDILIFRKN